MIHIIHALIYASVMVVLWALVLVCLIVAVVTSSGDWFLLGLAGYGAGRICDRIFAKRWPDL